MKELWDVYDADGKIIPGRVTERGKHGLGPGEYHLVVFAWIINDKNEFIISKRQKGRIFAGKWECTGGCALTGDSSVLAAVREVSEELGLTLSAEDGELFKRYRREYPSGARAICDVWVFRKNFELSDITVQPEEVSEAKFVSAEELLELFGSGAYKKDTTIFRNWLRSILQKGENNMKNTKMYSEIFENPRVVASLETLNKDTLVSITRVLKERNVKHVTFAARGTSDHASIYGQYLMSVLGGKVTSLALPSAITLYGADMSFSSDDLVIGVSQSGAAEDVLSVMNSAKKCGAAVVAITNHKDSKMAKAADWHLDCGAGEEYALAATKTFVGEIGLICLLAAYWFENRALLDSFRALPAILENTLKKLDGEIENIAQRYIYARDGFILSRGMTYPVALESSLKVQETCFIRMKGYSVSDFYHGPFAQVEKGTPIIVYAPEGKGLPDNLAVIDRLTGMEVDPLVVTDSEEVAKKYAFTCLLPSTNNEFTSVFVMAVFAQMFSEKLCTLRRLDPDVSRNLKKVTVTK